jgi:endonuclease/exonuclease/phosphatase family metal-dependent hydrolase
MANVVWTWSRTQLIIALMAMCSVAAALSAQTKANSTKTSSSTGTTLRVMQWNIHKTKGSDGVCNPDRIISQIVKQNPDIVSLNEVNFYSGACAKTFDMGAKLDSLLQQKSGVKWYGRSVNVEWDPKGGTSGYGNVLLSRIAPRSDSTHLLSHQRGFVQMSINVNGRDVNVFSTHVDYDNATYRTAQIQELLNAIQSFSEPRITLGDFNMRPNTSDYALMATPYQDAWAAAQSAGIGSAYNGTGNTRGESRFDYAFYSRNSALTLKSVTVPDTRVDGVYSSDHDPVVAVFLVK